MELDENKLPKDELQKLINEEVERIAGIFQMKYGVSKTSFYKMILLCSSAYRNGIENLAEAAGFYNEAKTGISLSGKAEALENYFECSNDLITAIEEITNE